MSINIPTEILAKLSSDEISKLEMVHNFVMSSARFAKSGLQSTPPEILDTRESICRSCDQWDAAALRNTGRCKKCGCSTWAKLRMATERCPLGKWEAVSAEDSKK